MDMEGCADFKSARDVTDKRSERDKKEISDIRTYRDPVNLRLSDVYVQMDDRSSNTDITGSAAMEVSDTSWIF